MNATHELTCRLCNDPIPVLLELPEGVEIDSFNADAYCADCARSEDEAEARVQSQQDFGDFSDSLAAHACGFSFR